ncbi:IclR family transcriptional regulator [Bosea sp. (in: a-proteobacteria)]|uniref:IclR family transcriptional regulator n=1 Tax=Bosea sp. (in: a-proteobacteria) TaxID=1871050 RepID=UPI002626CC77|nr:IclR family transcriptional regulator [Bosea sp. (in: a-proteobacteria)]MCO5091685.1 IclR family transcriptional regulator [Bosea sp. (in: a-proteobacteria)]
MENGAINRVLRLLSLLSDHASLTVRQAAEELGLPVSTVHRLLRRLAESGFAAQPERGLFNAGTELFRMAGKLSARMPYVSVAEPLLGKLTAQFQETSMLGILERKQLRMHFAASAAPADPMRYVVELNKPAPLVWGAVGRSMLAHLSPPEIERAIETNTATDVHGTALDPDELRAHLSRIRAEGYALTQSHRTLNSVGLAAPFFDPNGQVLGCIAFQLPAFRLTSAALPRLASALKDSAAVVSQRMGG